jgi:hypothetical protein
MQLGYGNQEMITMYRNPLGFVGCFAFALVSLLAAKPASQVTFALFFLMFPTDHFRIFFVSWFVSCHLETL